MHSGATKPEYPISIFLNSLMAGRTRDEFVRSLGYWKRIDRGRHRLDLWLDDGNGHEKILRQIVLAHPAAAEGIAAAVDATRTIKKAEKEQARRIAVRDVEERARRKFRSFIWVHTEDGAHSFFSAMGERHLKVLCMGDGFESLSDADKLSAVQKRIREHYAKIQRWPGFGAILQYRWAKTFDTSVLLDTSGKVIEAESDQMLLPEVWLALHPPEFC